MNCESIPAHFLGRPAVSPRYHPTAQCPRALRRNREVYATHRLDDALSRNRRTDAYPQRGNNPAKETGKFAYRDPCAAHDNVRYWPNL